MPGSLSEYPFSCRYHHEEYDMHVMIKDDGRREKDRGRKRRSSRGSADHRPLFLRLRIGLAVSRAPASAGKGRALAIWLNSFAAGPVAGILGLI